MRILIYVYEEHISTGISVAPSVAMPLQAISIAWSDFNILRRLCRKNHLKKVKGKQWPRCFLVWDSYWGMGIRAIEIISPAILIWRDSISSFHFATIADKPCRMVLINKYCVYHNRLISFCNNSLLNLLWVSYLKHISQFYFILNELKI